MPSERRPVFRGPSVWEAIRQAGETGRPNVDIRGASRCPAGMRGADRAEVDVLELLKKCERKPPEVPVEVLKVACDICARLEMGDMAKVSRDGRVVCSACISRWRRNGMDWEEGQGDS